MTMTFWVIAVVLLTAAVLFVVPPLLRRRVTSEGVARETLNIAIYRDQLAELDRDLNAGTLSPDQFDQAKRELERRMLDDVGTDTGAAASVAVTGRIGRWTAAGLAIALPLVAVATYLKYGQPAAIATRSPNLQATAAPPTTDQINSMVAGLAARLAENPDDPEGWVMLARSYFVLQRFPEASSAYAKAIALVGDEPDLLVDYADALAMASGQSLEGKPMELVNRALALNPDHQKGLWLAGTAAFDKGDYLTAAEHWEHLYKTLPPSSETARVVANNIAQAQERAGVEPTFSDATTPGISGTVRLAPALAARAAPTDTVFIVARAASGPRMPLAIDRVQVRDLPYRFVLTDAMAMMPDMQISNFSDVIVSARVSKTGAAMPASGDLQAEGVRVHVGADTALELVISDVVP